MDTGAKKIDRYELQSVISDELKECFSVVYLPSQSPVEHQIDYIKSEMRGGIGKGTDSNHPTHVQKLVKTQDFAQRPHRECDEKEYQCPIPGAMDKLSDRPRIELNRVGIVNRLAEWREQAHQCDDTEGRYVVAGIAPNFERVSQPIFPNEPGNGVDDNNPRSWRVALGRAVTARVLPKICAHVSAQEITLGATTFLAMPSVPRGIHRVRSALSGVSGYSPP